MTTSCQPTTWEATEPTVSFGSASRRRLARRRRCGRRRRACSPSASAVELGRQLEHPRQPGLADLFRPVPERAQHRLQLQVGADHGPPDPYGSVSTGGLGGEADRSLLDFLTVDVDHLGAANVAWADDNNSRSDTRNKFARQIAGNSVYQNQPVNLMQAWPIRDHAVADPAGDVRNAAGLQTAVACPSMDVLKAATPRSGDLLTVTLTLGAPPSAANAVACAAGGATGGLWGAEFWASSEATSQFGGGPNANFYVAYRVNPGDVSAPTPGIEGGRVDALGVTLTHDEFHREVPGVPATPAGTCFSPLPPAPCTVSMTVSLSSLGIKPGSGLYSTTGGSFYYFATEEPATGTRVSLGFSNQADVTAALDDNGTGTTK